MVDWKKEIKLGDLVSRKGESDPEAPVATATGPAEAADPGDGEKTSIWKREIRLRKPMEGAEARPSISAGRPPALTKAGDAGKGPSRYARPGAPKPGSMEPAAGPSRRSRFSRPGSEKSERTSPERAPGRFSFGRRRSADPAATADAPTGVARETAEPGSAGKAGGRFSRFSRSTVATPVEGERTRRPSRFARPGAPKPGAGDVAEPRTRGRSPLAREISFSFRRRPKTGDAAGRLSRRASSRKRDVVGLKVGASHLSAAHVVSNGHSEIVQVARDAIDRGIVVGGELRDPDALGAALGEFFRDHKLPQKAVRLGIGTNRIGVRRLEIAGLQDRSHLENAVRFRAQEVLPIPLEEAVLDYQVVGETTDDKGHTVYRVLLVVAYRDLIARYVRACRAAGLKLVGIDLEAFALLRSLGPQADEPHDDAAVVIVSIGHDRSTFVVADGDTCEFARVLDWGGGALDVALARALDRTPSQVEAVKHQLTLNATQERLEGFSTEEATAVYEAVRRELQTFVRELVSSLHFYQNQPGSLGIGEITITGGTAQLPGLAAELQRLIGVGVRVGDPFARVATSKRVDQRVELGSLAVAIGLGLEG